MPNTTLNMNVDHQFVRFALASAIIGGTVFSGLTHTTPASAWNGAAANYLDTRELWWQSWRPAQRDHGTVCISCHTVVPYALARPALRGQSDNTLAIPERIMFNNIVKRVTLWNDVEPFYKDSPSGPTKSIESRGTEAVLNALILASYDARRNHLTDITRTAFNEAWALQQQSGDKAGAWIWLNFHNAPWESNESEYHGAALAALAVGIAPDNYRDDPKIQPNLELLRAYLRREYHTQPLVNRLVLLWASAKLPGLLTPPERADLIKTVLTHQQPDGGWSLTDLGTWKRHDNTPLETRSDGYATGLTVLALEENGQQHLPQTTQGIAWLRHNQDPTEGLWPAWSLNKKREPTSDIYHFMDDASTAYAVLALEQAPK
jgi:squalene-hopene/tetraprenyl-beta-curcumene cyclase